MSDLCLEEAGIEREGNLVEVGHAEPTACRDDPELGHMTADLPDRAGSFCDQPIPDPMQHQQRLLRLALHRNEPHARTLDGLTTTGLYWTAHHK